MYNNEVKIGMRVKYHNSIKMSVGTVVGMGHNPNPSASAAQDVIVKPDVPLPSEEKYIARMGGVPVMAGMLEAV